MQELVKMCHTQAKPDIKLQICYNLCQMLDNQQMDEDMTKEVKEMGKFTQDLLTNPEFRRAVHKRTALMEREPITYFGEETLKNDQYDYDEDLEKDLTTIEFRITTFLGNVLRWLQEQSAGI